MKCKLLACTTFLLLALPVTVSAEPATALKNICAIVQADDKSELRKKMRNVRKEYGLKLGDYYTGVQCNNQSMLRHAIDNGSVESGTLLVKKMPKSLLNASESDGQTISEWAATNSKGDSAIVSEIIERLN